MRLSPGKTALQVLGGKKKSKPWRTAKGKAKIKKTMTEWKAENLHSGSKHGPKVTSKAQALAISLSQARKAAK